MREIKFRAWDKEKKVMITPFYSIDNGGRWSVHNWEDLCGPLNAMAKINVQVMQFTGLKDKNGKDVYEGDIVCGNPKFKYVICWADDRAKYIQKSLFRVKGNLRAFKAVSDLSKSEVVGNLYENQDLITHPY